MNDIPINHLNCSIKYMVLIYDSHSWARLVCRGFLDNLFCTRRQLWNTDFVLANNQKTHLLQNLHSRH